METIAGSSDEIPSELSSSAEVVMSNDDLLIQILLRLPIISLLLFKSVSKRWISLITAPNFTLRRIQIPNLEPPSGFLVQPEIQRLEFELDFVPLDIRIPYHKRSFPTNNVRIHQSCNGLLLCRVYSTKEYYVYNPTINKINLLPQRSNVNVTRAGIQLAFDPTKSVHYKVVYVGVTHDGVGSYIQIQTYSSQTGVWSVSGDRFSPVGHIEGFKRGIYWNGAIHWLLIENRRPLHLKLDIGNCQSFIRVNNPCQSFIRVNNPSYVDAYKNCRCKLLESRGCLYLFCRGTYHSRHLYVYEMRNEYFGWSLKNIVKLHDIINPVPKNWSLCDSVWSIVLDEKEEESFLVMAASGKVLQYKLASRTVRLLHDFGSTSRLRDKYFHLFIASFASV